jgi:hypothetical protein
MTTDLMMEIDSSINDSDDNIGETLPDESEDIKTDDDAKEVKSEDEKEKGEEGSNDPDGTEKEPGKKDPDSEEETKKEKLTRAERRRRYNQAKEARFNGIIKDNYELKKRLSELESNRQDPLNDLVEPDTKDFTDQREYDQAYGKYMAKKELFEHKKAESEKEAFTKDISDVNNSLEKDISKFPKFFEETKTLMETPMSQALIDVLKVVDNPSAVLVHLSKDPALALKISKESVTKQAYYFTRMAMNLAVRDNKKVVVSKAKPPVEKIKGSTSSTKSLGEMNAEEYYNHVYGKNKKKD